MIGREPQRLELSAAGACWNDLGGYARKISTSNRMKAGGSLGGQCWNGTDWASCGSGIWQKLEGRASNMPGILLRAINHLTMQSWIALTSVLETGSTSTKYS